jgi:hypothetical protein
VLVALARPPDGAGASGGTRLGGSGTPGGCGPPSVPAASATVLPDSRALRLDEILAQTIQPVHPMSTIATKTTSTSISRPPRDTGWRVQIQHASAARLAAHVVDSHHAAQTRGADRPGGARETGPQRTGAGPGWTRDADRRAPGCRTGTRSATARIAESPGVGRRASRANRDAAAILVGGRSPSGPRTRAQLSGSARAARSGRGEDPPSASVAIALTTRRNDKSRCHMRDILAGEPHESQGGSGLWCTAGERPQYARQYQRQGLCR